MAIISNVENGVVTKTDASKEATESKKQQDSSGFDKELFLKLLVAEMQYQDPLEPTSNSEYVTQLSSFSQIEAIQNVEDQMKNMEAASLVGKYVILLHQTPGGNSEWVSGKVDYVMNDGGDIFLSVNDQLYSIDELDSITDEPYYHAVTMAQAFVDAVMALPNIYSLTLQDADKVKAARDMFDAMDSYQKQFVDEKAVKSLENVEKRMEELRKAAGLDEVEEQPGDAPAEDEGEENIKGDG